MASQEHEKHLTARRYFLLKLISDGETLLIASKENGMAETEFTIQDIQATLNSLLTTFFCEHGPKNSEKQNKLIEGLFDGQKS